VATGGQVRELCMMIWKDSNSSRNVWAILAATLESVLSRGGSASDEGEEPEVKWTRTTLATGFSVKRAGINPGAPGFVYPFYPHKSMRRRSVPPHLLGTSHLPRALAFSIDLIPPTPPPTPAWCIQRASLCSKTRGMR